MQESICHLTSPGPAVLQLAVFFSSGLHRVLILISTRHLLLFYHRIQASPPSVVLWCVIMVFPGHTHLLS